jgi:hypothetical protein
VYGLPKSSRARIHPDSWLRSTQADRQEGKRILGDLPRLQRGEGYLWAPGRGILDRAAFPAIRTFDSSRTPKRGERLAVPRTLAEVDLTAIVAALAAVGGERPEKRSAEDHRRQSQLERELAAATARIAALEQENRDLTSRLAKIAALVEGEDAPAVSVAEPRPTPKAKPPWPVWAVSADVASGNGLHPAARKLLVALAQHAPARFTWGQAATLAGLKPSGGHFNAGRKSLRDAGYVTETSDPGSGSGTSLVMASPTGLKAVGEVPAAPSTPAERLALWCDRLPSPAPEMLRTLAAEGERYMEADELAVALGKKPTGGHWNSGIAVLRNNGLIETEPGSAQGSRRYRAAPLLRG